MRKVALIGGIYTGSEYRHDMQDVNTDNFRSCSKYLDLTSTMLITCTKHHRL